MSIQIINQQKVLGKDLKIYGSVEEPLFLAKDVTEWIEHSQTSKMLNPVSIHEKIKKVVRTNGGDQECWFLTEGGIYDVLIRSRKPIAKELKTEIKNILTEFRANEDYIKNQMNIGKI